MVGQRRILFFTIHKSASMFIHRVCADLARIANLIYYSPNGGDVPVPLKEMATSKAFWVDKQSGCFAPLRTFFSIPDMDKDRILLHLRDPRDVLVSMYFSYCYSHSGEVTGGTGYRKAVADSGIDDFVLKLATADHQPVSGDYGTGAHLWEIAGNIKQRYSTYVDHFLKGDHANVVLLRYEEMIADLDGWLGKIADEFEVGDPAVVRRLADDYRPVFDRKSENAWVHMRRVTPGDYLEKLRPATIAELDRIFGDTLHCLGY